LSYAPTGVVESIESPDAVLSYTFDGPLPTRERWSGRVTGRIDRVFDNNFWMRSGQIAGTPPIACTYDDGTNTACDLRLATGGLAKDGDT